MNRKNVAKKKFKVSCLFIYILHPAILGKIMTNAKNIINVDSFKLQSKRHFDSCFIRRGSSPAGRNCVRPLIAAPSKLRPKLASRIYAPEPCARFRVGARWSSWATFDGSARRGARSIKHTCSTAAESPWLEVSTVGLSCRLLIAGTMQQMALIAIPTSPSPRSVFPLGLPSSLFRLLSPPATLFFALCTAISSFFRRSCRFSRILPREFPPR